MARIKSLSPRLNTKAAPRLATGQTFDQVGRLRRRKRPSWYSTKRWQELRLVQLEKDEYICQQTGVLLSQEYPGPFSPTVDHVIPHRWDPELFWDETNLQSVTKAWHDKEKQRMERAGLI